MKGIREKLFNLMKSFGFTMKMYDSEGNGPLLSSDEVEYMYAKKGNQSYMLVIEDGDSRQYNNVTVYRSNIENKDEFRSILKRLKDISIREVFSLSIKNFGRNFTPKDFSLMPKEKQSKDVSESYDIKGSKKTSYHIKEKARVIVKHTKNIDEDISHARSRNIQEVYVAVKNERRKVSEHSLSVGKAVANYVNSGGNLFDNNTNLMISLGNDTKRLRKIDLNETKLTKEHLNKIKTLGEESRKMITKFIATLAKKKNIDENIFECFSGPEFDFTKTYFECIIGDKELAESLTRASIIKELFL